MYFLFTNFVLLLPKPMSMFFLLCEIIFQDIMLSYHFRINKRIVHIIRIMYSLSTYISVLWLIGEYKMYL